MDIIKYRYSVVLPYDGLTRPEVVQQLIWLGIPQDAIDACQEADPDDIEGSVGLTRVVDFMDEPYLWNGEPVDADGNGYYEAARFHTVDRSHWKAFQDLLRDLRVSHDTETRGFDGLCYQQGFWRPDQGVWQIGLEYQE